MALSPLQQRLKALLNKNTEQPHPTANIHPTPRQELASAIAEEESQDQDIQYNEQQLDFIDSLVAGKSLVLTGPAGSGKTTTVRGGIKALIQNEKLDRLGVNDHKWLKVGMYSIACCSFTNKAVNNLKKALPKDLHGNCMTIHKLLEFAPVYESEYDDDGNERTKMRFVPSRHNGNKLPSIDVLVIDEATMTDVTLWNLVVDALPHGIQVILIGDIHQLPPVFGKSIFIHAMQRRVKTIELTHIYRQALLSPIIRLATRIREGKQIPQKELPEFTSDDGEHGKVTIHPWKKKLGEMAAIKTIQMFLPQMIDSGAYNPIDDVILTPFNKSFGTIVMNTCIATHLAKIETDPRKKEVWEVYSGIKKVYLRIGEKVLHNKSEAFVIDIQKNKDYYGKLPRSPSTTMDYNGIESDPEKRIISSAGTGFGGMDSEDSIDSMLAHFSSHVEEDSKVSREASHIIKLYVPDLDTEVEVSKAGDINGMDLAYALTVHKSQGSEYPRVFLITHGSQANMFFRELLYTGVTRAAKELYVICEPNFFVKGVVTQRVPGNTLEDKIASFDRTMKLGKHGTAELPLGMEMLVDSENDIPDEWG